MLLQQYWMCDRFGSLPYAGGVFDQPAGLLDKMAILSNVYDAHKSHNAAKNGAQWADNNPQMMKIIAMVWRLREEDGPI